MAGDGKEKATLRSPRGKKSTAITAWDEIKSDVRRIYIQEDKSLEETMASFQLNACVRTWKAQLKEWDFNKNVPSNVMQYVVSKANKRKREGKDTIFFYGITEINPQKIENFKRRKTGVTPSFPRTPPHLTYYTPNPNCEKAFQNELCKNYKSNPLSLSDSSELSVAAYASSVRSLRSGSDCSHIVQSKFIELPIISTLNRFIYEEPEPWSPYHLLRRLGTRNTALARSLQLLNQVVELVAVSGEQIFFPEICCTDNQFLLSSYFSMDKGKQDGLLDTAASIDSLLEDLLTQTVTLAEFQNKYGEFGWQTLIQRFGVAIVAYRSGCEEEAEYHCRRILDSHPQIDVQTFLGMILAKAARLEESTHLLFSAVSVFIIQFELSSIAVNDLLFGLILDLFNELYPRNEQRWTALRSCMLQMMTTIRNSIPEGTTRQISPQLFMYGFSLTHQCYSLGIIDSAKYMYEELLEHFPCDPENVIHRREKAKAHQRYGYLLKDEGRWISSAKQLLLACKVARGLGTRGSPLIALLNMDFFEILPYLTSEIHEEHPLMEDIRRELARNKHQSSSHMQVTSETVQVLRINEYLRSDLPIPLVDFSDVAHLGFPSRLTESMHRGGKLTSTTSMSAGASHKYGMETYPDSEITGISDPLYGFYPTTF